MPRLKKGKTYVIGDVQGCFDALLELLAKIKFNHKKDKIIFCGDLVNRGGQSLQVLRWVYANQKVCSVILGNHDLSLLAQYHVQRLRKKNNHEFQAIFQASDCALLLNWLRHQKLLIHKKKYNKVITHAGIYPTWSLKRAKIEAKNVENWLQKRPKEFFNKMYGAKPNHWSENLKGMNRARFAVNSLTRMRFLFKNGGLNFKAKGEIETFPKLIPWFKYQPHVAKKAKIIIGHWSALGLYIDKNIICLDTGKVWGGKLTALCLTKNNKLQQYIYQV